MTHEELLAEINKELEITHWEAWHEGARALLAVVELHKSWPGGCSHCVNIEGGYMSYPCPTIQAIEKQLS